MTLLWKDIQQEGLPRHIRWQSDEDSRAKMLPFFCDGTFDALFVETRQIQTQSMDSQSPQRQQNLLSESYPSRASIRYGEVDRHVCTPNDQIPQGIFEEFADLLRGKTVYS